MSTQPPPPGPCATRVLIVDDEVIACEQLAEVLERPGRSIEWVVGGEAALASLRADSSSTSPFDVVITDLVMPKVDGLAVLKMALTLDSTTRVIVLTGRGTLESAVEALRAGAWHYVTKPYELADMRGVVAGAEAAARTLRGGGSEDRRDGDDPRAETDDRCTRPAGSAVQGRGEDPLRAARRRHAGVEKMPAATALADLAASRHSSVRQVAETARAVAASDATIVVHGETGTGKERLVRAIHLSSLRRNGPFLAVNCGAFPDELLDSVLFGHVRGAFTGAGDARDGLFVAARGGTLFLDEFAEMSPAMQVKLLRVLESREVLPLGATRTVPIDVRLVVASHRRLEHEVASGSLRADLFYRVNVVALTLPPLRERPDDIPGLASALLAEHVARLKNAGTGDGSRPAVHLTATALDRLSRHAWPGNIRELSNVLERALLLQPGGNPAIDLSVTAFLAPQPPPDSPMRDRRGAPADNPPTRGGPVADVLSPDRPTVFPTLAAHERDAIIAALKQTAGHRSRAAKLLGIDRVSLWRKMKRYGISAES